MTSEQWIGWGASAILVVTIYHQAFAQWRASQEGDGDEGASPWLFAGQIAASAGFTTYAALKGDPVFVTTNALLLVAGALGLWICLRSRGAAGRRRGARRLFEALEPHRVPPTGGRRESDVGDEGLTS